MSLDKELGKIGLSDKEARVYLASLELGQTSVQNISRKADVNRATTYSVLESLVKKGLCSTTEQNKKVYYSASSPNALLSLFEIKKKKIETQEEYFKKMLPELSSLHNKQESKPTVRFFEGKQGLLNSVSEFYFTKVDDSEPVRMLYNKDLIEEVIDEKDRLKFRKIRLGRKIKSKVIYNYEQGVLQTTADGQRRRISSEDSLLKCDIEILGNSVLFAPLTEKLSSVLIKNQEITDTLKVLFDLAWLGAEIKKEE